MSGKKSIEEFYGLLGRGGLPCFCGGGWFLLFFNAKLWIFNKKIGLYIKYNKIIIKNSDFFENSDYFCTNKLSFMSGLFLIWGDSNSLIFYPQLRFPRFDENFRRIWIALSVIIGVFCGK